VSVWGALTRERSDQQWPAVALPVAAVLSLVGAVVFYVASEHVWALIFVILAISMGTAAVAVRRGWMRTDRVMAVFSLLAGLGGLGLDVRLVFLSAETKSIAGRSLLVSELPWLIGLAAIAAFFLVRAVRLFRGTAPLGGPQPSSGTHVSPSSSV